jgi:hypothetical protein
MVPVASTEEDRHFAYILRSPLFSRHPTNLGARAATDRFGLDRMGFNGKCF